MNNQELIEKYTNGELSDAERMAFENQLANDTILMEALLAYQKSRLAIKAAIREELRNETGHALKDWKKKKRRKSIYYLVGAVAASALLIFSIYWAFFWPLNSTSSSEQLFATYFEMPRISNIRESNNDKDTSWQLAVASFKEKAFSETIRLLPPLLSDPEFKRLNEGFYLLGLAHLAEAHPQEAASYLKRIEPSSSFQQDAEWYLALAYLKNGQINEAKDLLGKIARTPRHFKQKEAGTLEKQLE